VREGDVDDVVLGMKREGGERWSVLGLRKKLGGLVRERGRTNLRIHTRVMSVKSTIGKRKWCRL